MEETYCFRSSSQTMVQTMALLTFLQFSDVHLDCSLAGSRLALPPRKRERINRDIEQALVRTAALARSRQVDVVLCPGDLWDDEAVSFERATMLYDLLGSLAPIPVLLAPGNHDPLNAFSYHHAPYYRHKVGRDHPANVFVFSTPQLQRLTLPMLPGVDFYGCCFEENRPRHERLLGQFRPERPEALNVLLLHGSQDDALAPSQAMLAAPFSRSEILASGFDYVALGHYHRFSRIRDNAGHVRAAYSGVLSARTLDETGDHGVLLGELNKQGTSPEGLEKLSVDERKILQLSVPIDSTLTHSSAAKERVAQALRAAEVTPEDIAYVSLQGRTHPQITQFDFDSAWCDSQCFHLVVDQSALEPEYDIEGLLGDETARKRVEGRFAERMRQLLDQAHDDPARQRLLRLALCYGLDALRGKEMEPRDVY